jgi:lysophospholipase L1-like esterase
MKSRNALYYSYLLAVTLIATELILRVYNPFPTGIKGNKIVLRVNVKYVVENREIPVLDKTITHTKNSLGFRGAGPEAMNNRFSIITVGGSTTECTYLNDGKTWTDGLGKKLDSSFTSTWINNAGLAGHSSFGHLVLLQDYLVKLKPKMIVMMLGCNDMNRNDLTMSDRYSMRGMYGSTASFFTKNSELANIAATYARAGQASSMQIVDRYIDLAKEKNNKLEISEQAMAEKLAVYSRLLKEYESRLQAIVETCRQHNIDLVLVSQPALFGRGTDPLTGADLEKYRIDNETNGLLWWKELSLYNEVTRQVAGRNGLFFIDLARQMPKSSLYFYDLVHFTNEGAAKVSEIIHDQLLTYLITKHKLL